MSENRTRDLVLTKHALYLLSYHGAIFEISFSLYKAKDNKKDSSPLVLNQGDFDKDAVWHLDTEDLPDHLFIGLNNYKAFGDALFPVFISIRTIPAGGSSWVNS